LEAVSCVWDFQLIAGPIFLVNCTAVLTGFEHALQQRHHCTVVVRQTAYWGRQLAAQAVVAR
jgi:hypothetical protein